MPKELATISQLPGFRQTLKARLYEMAEDQILHASSTACELICTALEQDEYVDLSLFRSFPSEYLCQIVSHLQSVGKMTTLNVSNCAHIAAADLENVINIESNLHTIYALEMPQIPLGTIIYILNSPSNRISQAYHTELFQKALQIIARERKDLIQTPQSDNFSTANPIDQLILVRVLLEKSQDEPKRRAREYFDWSQDQPESRARENFDWKLI